MNSKRPRDEEGIDEQHAVSADVPGIAPADGEAPGSSGAAVAKQPRLDVQDSVSQDQSGQQHDWMEADAAAVLQNILHSCVGAQAAVNAAQATSDQQEEEAEQVGREMARPGWLWLFNEY